MAKKQIGATLVLKDGGFKTNIKSAMSQLSSFKKNTESATSSLKNMDSQSASIGKSLGNLAKKVVGVIAAYAGIRKVIDIGKEAVAMAQKAEEANVRLNTIMDQIPGITNKAKDSVANLCTEMSKQTTISATAQKSGASQLASFQMSADSIEKLLPQLNNLAVANYGVNVTSDQMIQAANMLGKAYSGQTGALSRAGIVMTDAQAKMIKTGDDAQKSAALVEILNQNFGDLAKQMANTSEGRIVRIQNALNSVKVTLGNALLPVVASVAEYIAAKVPDLQTKVETAISKVAPYMQKAVDGIKTALDGAGQAISWLKDNWDALSPVIYGVVGAIAAYNVITGIKNGLTSIAVATTGLEAGAFSGLTIAQLASVAATGALTAAQSALNAVFIASPIGWIVLAIGAVIAVIVVLYKKCDTFRNFVNQLFGKIVSGAKALWAGLKTVWNGIVNSLKPLIAAIKNAFQQAWEVVKIVWNYVKPYFQMVWNNIKAVFSVVKVYIGGMFKTAWEVVKAVWNAVSGYFTAVWNTIAGIFSVVKNVLTGNWSGAWEAIKGIVNTWAQYFASIWESIKSVFAAVGSWFGSTFSAAWEAIKSIFSNVTGFFQNIWNTIKSMFTSIGVSIANGISGAFKSVINGVIRFAGNLINGFIDSINWAIGVINKIPGVNITKLATVNLPMLWKGGTIEKPGDVIVGEKGPEMLSLPKGARVTPLDKAGTTNHNEFNITIHAENKSVGQIVNELVPQLKLALSNM